MYILCLKSQFTFELKMPSIVHRLLHYFESTKQGANEATLSATFLLSLNAGEEIFLYELKVSDTNIVSEDKSNSTFSGEYYMFLYEPIHNRKVRLTRFAYFNFFYEFFLLHFVKFEFRNANLILLFFHCSSVFFSL